ncbi:hypothetical protein MTF65_12535 [Streptomyces sp. APSN-46.1]|uniref:hypothetical protein n=1 Tax=Streptomyces sp. APSN-46.1 TaxID=2929049 RepID=UPI001FB4B0FC|nr:hypothetical protein [Streptomyces sp. APSN-46.1]MCJ1678156.1 hypothetical protein [Streptomyces sp. APSN-46.1]
MCSAETQAAALAALLSAALGGAETRTEATGDRIRIEADLPAELTSTAHAALLGALAAGGRFGHVRGRGGADTVWVEIDRGDGPSDKTTPHTKNTPNTPTGTSTPTTPSTTVEVRSSE